MNIILTTTRIEFVWNADEKYIVYESSTTKYSIVVESKMSGLSALFGDEYK